MKKQIAMFGLTGCLVSYCSLGLLFIKNEQPKIVNKSLTERTIARFCKDDYIAAHIAKTKYPYTLAAIAKVESEFKPHVIGDSGKSYGMYQIQSEIWGDFEKETIQGQTEKAEEVLESLITAKGYYEAIRAWNGSGRKAKAYRRLVLREIQKIKQIEKTA